MMSANCVDTYTSVWMNTKDGMWLSQERRKRQPFAIFTLLATINLRKFTATNFKMASKDVVSKFTGVSQVFKPVLRVVCKFAGRRRNGIILYFTPRAILVARHKRIYGLSVATMFHIVVIRSAHCYNRI